MEQVAPWRSTTTTVYGCSDNTSADDEAPATVPTLSVFILLCPFTFLLLPAFLSSTSLFQSFSYLPPLLSETTSSSVTCAFYNLCAPWSQLLALSASENKSVFFCLVSFCMFFYFFISSITVHIQNGQSSACTQTHQQTELWSVFVYDRERQYRDSFRVVSSREMYRCQECVLCV